MYPTLFHIPLINLPIYGYGLMMVCAFLGTQWLAGRLAKSHGYDPEIFVNVTLIALVSGVIGSRASHVLENTKIYFDPAKGFLTDLWNIVNIRSGGLTFYGGLILAAPIVLWYLLSKKVTARMAMDICAPCIMLGLGIGRIGCFLNGCCYGAPTSLPWAVSFPYYSNAYQEAYERQEIDVPSELLVPVGDHKFRLVSTDEIRQGYIKTGDKENPKFFLPENIKQIAAAQYAAPVHPAQLYSTITALLIMAILISYFYMPHTGGRVLALMLLLEGPTRFLLEMLRVEPPIWHGMSLSMIIGAILFVVGIILWISLGTRENSMGMPDVQPA